MRRTLALAASGLALWFGLAATSAGATVGFDPIAQARSVHAQMDLEQETWPDSFCVPTASPVFVGAASASNYARFDTSVGSGPLIMAEQESTLSSWRIAGTGAHSTDATHLGYAACLSKQYTSDSSASFSTTFVLTEPSDVRLRATVRASAYNVTWHVADASSFVRLREEGGATLKERTTSLPSPPASCETSTPCSGNTACETPCVVSDFRWMIDDFSLPAGTYVMEAGTSGFADAPGDITFMFFDEGHTSGTFDFELERLCGGTPCGPYSVPAVSAPGLFALGLALATSGASLAWLRAAATRPARAARRRGSRA